MLWMILLALPVSYESPACDPAVAAQLQYRIEAVGPCTLKPVVPIVTLHAGETAVLAQSGITGPVAVMKPLGTPTSVKLEPAVPVPTPRPPADGVTLRGDGLWYGPGQCEHGCQEIGDTTAITPGSYAHNCAYPEGCTVDGKPRAKPCGTLTIIHGAPNWVVAAGSGEHTDSFQIADGAVGCPPAQVDRHWAVIFFTFMVLYLWVWGTLVMRILAQRCGWSTNFWRISTWPIMWVTPWWWRK